MVGNALSLQAHRRWLLAGPLHLFLWPHGSEWQMAGKLAMSLEQDGGLTACRGQTCAQKPLAWQPAQLQVRGQVQGMTRPFQPRATMGRSHLYEVHEWQSVHWAGNEVCLSPRWELGC